jgi:polysaccharide biosynthesis transport protein
MTATGTGPDDMRMDIGALLSAILRRLLRIVLVTALVAGLAAALLMQMPKLYESSASLLVEPRENAYLRAPGDQGNSSSGITAEAMMSSQIELIKSRDLLSEVAKSEKLAEVPEFAEPGFSPVAYVLELLGRTSPKGDVDEIVLANLAQRMTVIRERDSAVVSIYVRSESPERAARIANALAATHIQRRTAQSISDTAEASVWLDREIARLREVVGKSETAVADFKIANDLFVGSNATPVTDQQLSTVASQILEAQQRRNAAEARAGLIRGLIDGGQAVEGIADIRDSVVVQSLLESKGTMQSELAQRSTTLLPNHPTVRALNAQISQIDGQIAAEALKIASALDVEARVEGELETKLKADLTAAKTVASSATKGSVTLDGLEREAKAQRDLLETYLARYSDASARTASNAALPDVRVIAAAAPSSEPASPKVALTLGAVAFVMLALQIGLIIFGELSSGRALRTKDGRGDEDVDTLDPPPFVPEADEATETPAPQVLLAAPAIALGPVTEPAPATEASVEASPASDSEESRNRPEIQKEELNMLEDELPEEPEAATINLDDLAASIGPTGLRAVLLAGLGRADRDLVIDRLIEEALAAGLSVAIVDAGTGTLTLDEGLSDLSADRAEYGDVVHRLDDNLAEVPWGRLAAIDRRSMRPLTLVDALADIYQLVIVDTGPIGMASGLPLFAGHQAPVMLVADDMAPAGMVAAARRDAGMLGFDIGFVVSTPSRHAAVA